MSRNIRSFFQDAPPIAKSTTTTPPPTKRVKTSSTGAGGDDAPIHIIATSSSMGIRANCQIHDESVKCSCLAGDGGCEDKISVATSSSSSAAAAIRKDGGGGPAISRTAGGDDFARNDQYPLGKINAHPRDKRIFMKESTHTYVIDGSSKYLTSVTTLLHDFFGHFDPVAKSEEIAARQWKKQEYKGKSAKQIRDMWMQNGKEQADLGTALHAQLEQYYNDLPVNEKATNTTEWTQFVDFHKREIESRGWVMYHPEWIIFNEELCLAGSMDAPFAVSSNNHQEIIIVDWKRTKDIDKGAYKNATGTGPCRDIPDSKVGHYSVQLNVYKWMLEQKYNVKVIGMYLAVFHPGQHVLPDNLPAAVGSDGKPCKYRFIEIKDNMPMVEEVMQLRREEVIALKKANAEEEEAVEAAIKNGKLGIICGDRKYTNADLIKEQLEQWNDDCRLMHGDAAGADKLAERVATKTLGWNSERIDAIPAEWDNYGKAAGPRRNQKMLGYKPDFVIAFHDKLWDSKATKQMVKLARDSGIPVRVIGNE